jgi:hypothetical protein
MKSATRKQIRQYYKAAGCAVWITRDGRVAYKPESASVWLDGWHVERYHVADSGVILGGHYAHS